MWDDILRKYIPRGIDIDDLYDGPMFDPDGGKRRERGSTEQIMGMVTEYARMIKTGYLDKKADDDEQGIKRLVEVMYTKNREQHGIEMGEEIVHKVLLLYVEDESIEKRKR